MVKEFKLEPGWLKRDIEKAQARIAELNPPSHLENLIAEIENTSLMEEYSNGYWFEERVRNEILEQLYRLKDLEH